VSSVTAVPLHVANKHTVYTLNGTLPSTVFWLVAIAFWWTAKSGWADVDALANTHWQGLKKIPVTGAAAAFKWVLGRRWQRIFACVNGGVLQ
jgi:hypothetical protein